MIALDLKSETTSSSPLNLKPLKDEESTISFSALLKGVKIGKKGANIVQNGALVLSLESVKKDNNTLNNTTKGDTLLSLLKNDEKKPESTKELLEINPKLTNMLDPKELKTLVSDAKKYLKSKILQSDDYKQLQIKELPKTLKGLSVLAKKIGIDVSKITLQEVQPKVKTKEIKIELKKAFKAEEISKVNVEIPHAKEIKNLVLKEIDNIQVIKYKTETEKKTPIFKSKIMTEHTTEQLVQVKQFKVEQKTPKDKANETLQLLLSGEKSSSEAQNITADFSVQTAKVIAPRVMTKGLKELESLLRDKTESSPEKDNASQIETISVHKVDSFEVKLNEAKQMIKYLSQDVKTAIEDYKSPFTRIKIQLNPQRLGKIDLTVVQRGKNLHVNLSSNSIAINALSMNATELKVQLQNSGINNASLNFSNNSGSQSNNAQTSGGQHHQHEKQAKEQYSYLQNEEANEVLSNSLEIVVPHYI